MGKMFPVLLLAVIPARAEIIVAEGERFTPQDSKGWKLTRQDDSFASHTYGGMWVTHGAGLGAPADSVGSVAIQTVQIPSAGNYRVWSKYQAPPYYNYLHKIDIIQNGKTVFSHVYGKKGTDRLWSFSGVSDELWWPWGVDHDAAEAPKTLASLAKGTAEIRLSTVVNEKPAGDRFVDFVVLTTNPADDYRGFKPYRVGTPFAEEALDATKLWMRFRNGSPNEAALQITRAGHFQPQYGGARMTSPRVAPGAWSDWFPIGPFCRLVHDEGLWLTLPGATGSIAVQVARDEAGKDLAGDLTVASGEAIVIPLEVTWNKQARVLSSRAHAERIVAESKKWRRANGGRKPRQIFCYGAFTGPEPWVSELKHTLGYNTGLPEKYPDSQWEGLHSHLYNAAQIQQFARTVKNRDRLRFVSFGDEISLGSIDFKSPANQTKFRAWLQRKGITERDLGIAPAKAELTSVGDARLVWYSNLFNEEERFADFRARTELVQKELGPNVLTGANYSPHHLALYYGPIFQWVDLFKHRGMSMIWAEDYIFSVPEVPQIISWTFAQMRCGAKYHNTPIHFYVMPHAPGQTPGNLRRNLLASVGFGARHIDSFWVAPPERFTENYVSWHYPETFRVLSESIFDFAEAEQLQAGGKVRPARVALITGKATDFNESRLMIDKKDDPFASRCKNAPARLNQILCRKDQQMLYLALVQAGHAVDLITEDDIVEREELKRFDVVYFAGEWIDARAVPRLEAWVRSGGVLYATAGIGRLNQFQQPEPAMLKLLGLKSESLKKNVAVLRTLLELPLLEPIDTITIDGAKVPAVGMRQVLTPDGAKVLGRWADGSPAVTLHELGKGKAYAVGTLAGNTWMRTGVKARPWARGGNKTSDHPTQFDPAASKLARLGVDARVIEKAVESSDSRVEAIVVDHPRGTLVTLVNWTNAPVKGLKLSVKLNFQPRSVRTVSGQKELPVTVKDGRASLQVDLAEADFLLFLK